MERRGPAVIRRAPTSRSRRPLRGRGRRRARCSRCSGRSAGTARVGRDARDDAVLLAQPVDDLSRRPLRLLHADEAGRERLVPRRLRPARPGSRRGPASSAQRARTSGARPRRARRGRGGARTPAAAPSGARRRGTRRASSAAPGGTSLGRRPSIQAKYARVSKRRDQSARSAPTRAAPPRRSPSRAARTATCGSPRRRRRTPSSTGDPCSTPSRGRRRRRAGRARARRGRGSRRATASAISRSGSFTPLDECTHVIASSAGRAGAAPARSPSTIPSADAASGSS